MKVWIVVHDDYENTMVDEVYVSEELAKTHEAETLDTHVEEWDVRTELDLEVRSEAAIARREQEMANRISLLAMYKKRGF